MQQNLNPYKAPGSKSFANKSNSLPHKELILHLDCKPILSIFKNKSTYANCHISPSTTHVPNFRPPCPFFFQVYQHLSLVTSFLFPFIQLFYSIFLILFLHYSQSLDSLILLVFVEPVLRKLIHQASKKKVDYSYKLGQNMV